MVESTKPQLDKATLFKNYKQIINYDKTLEPLISQQFNDPEKLAFELRSICFLGHTGSGKSTTLNTLIGQEAFKTSHSTKSET
jgi:putative ribosome biogenesis GTPase RsgA